MIVAFMIALLYVEFSYAGNCAVIQITPSDKHCITVDKETAISAMEVVITVHHQESNFIIFC
jgi:hypothetical protein